MDSQQLAFRHATHGRSVFATQSQRRGRLLLTEQPFVAMPTEPGLLVCDTCLAPVGSIGGQVQHVLGWSSRPVLPLSDEDAVLSDELKQLYVACTRARERLVFFDQSATARKAFFDALLHRRIGRARST